MYKRILLKLSGESLAGKSSSGISNKKLIEYATEIESVVKKGVEVAVVVGGGNIFRGGDGMAIDRVQGDHMGMLATVINGLALQSALENNSIKTRLMTAVKIDEIAEPFIRRRAIRHLEKKRVVIFGAGTGNPFFTTDTASSLRASEMNCDIIIKATKVNGVYDKDPIVFPNAKLLKNITYKEVITKNIKVMDATAVTLASESKIPIIVTSLKDNDALINVLNGIGNYSIIS